VVSQHQSVELGLTASAVLARRRSGRLYRLHRGVYAVGSPALTRHGALIAAALALGSDSAVSHWSAAWTCRMTDRHRARIDVTVPGPGGRRRRSLIVVHRSALLPGDRQVVDGVPVTSPARTIIDLADVVAERTLERLLDQAAVRDLDLTGLAPRPGRRGSGRLARVLERHRPGSTLTRSELEEAFLTLCAANGVPRPPVVNRFLVSREVDFAWPRSRLVLETDGRGVHHTVGAFERDRADDAALVAAGWRVMRVTYRRMLEAPDAVAREVLAALAPGGSTRNRRQGAKRRHAPTDEGGRPEREG
jgi:hypothetical protein